MSFPNTIHNGFISSIHKDTLTPFYTTVSNNEIIPMIDKNNNQREINSLTIESDSTALYIQLLPSEYCVYVRANNGYYTINDLSIKQIKVLGNSGQKIRWYGFYY